MIFLLFSCFHFFTCFFEVSLLCTPKVGGLDFSSKLQPSKMPGKLQHDQFLFGKLGNFIVTDFCTFSCFKFLACFFEVSLLCTPKGGGSDFSSKLQLFKMPGKLQNVHFLFGKLGNFICNDFLLLS